MIVFFDNDSYSIGTPGVHSFKLHQESVVNELNLLHFLNCEKIVFFDDQADEVYIKDLYRRSKNFNRANQAIVSEHEIRDRHGKSLPNNSILHSRTTECRTGLNLPFVKVLPKGKKYQPTSMAHIRALPKKLIKGGILGPTPPPPFMF